MAAAALTTQRSRASTAMVLQEYLHFSSRGFTQPIHDDVIKRKHFPRNWPFVREIHRSTVNFPHKGQWRGALMFSLMYALINDWVNNREAGDLRLQHGHYDVIVMIARIYFNTAGVVLCVWKPNQHSSVFFLFNLQSDTVFGLFDGTIIFRPNKT